MRTRTRTIIQSSVPATSVTLLRTTRFCDGTSISPNVTYNVPVCLTDYSVERMDDMPKARLTDNPVLHRKLTYQYKTDQGPLIGPTGPPYGVTTTQSQGSHMVWPLVNKSRSEELLPWRMFEKTEPLVDSPPRWTIVTDQAREAKLVEDCFEKAGELKADMLLNLIEGNKMIPSIVGVMQQLRSWRNPASFARTAQKRLRSFYKGLSNDFLAWKFGFSPIISDIEATMQHAKKMRADLDRYMKQDTFRYSASYNPTCIPNIADTIIPYGNGCDRYSEGYTVGCAPIVRYVLKVKPKLSGINRLADGLDYMFSRFASQPANLAWELVPYSFVWDWFFDMRGVCRLVNHVAGLDPYEVHSFTRSLKYDLTSIRYLTRTSPCSGAILRDGEYGRCRYEHYERRPTSQAPRKEIWGKVRFGKIQAAEAAALITQFLLRAKR